jgi:hypothetical protein
VELLESAIKVFTDDAAAIQPLIDAVRGTGVEIRSVVPVRMSLEDLFVEAVEGGGR